MRINRFFVKAILLVAFLLGWSSLCFPSSTIYLPLVLKDYPRPGFSILLTAHGDIIYQNGVSLVRAQEVGDGFEDAFQVVGTDLGFPAVRPRLYVYKSRDDLYNDLINTWHYPEWFRTYQVFPRMNANYEAWIPPDEDVWFIGHEYSHRIIEQVAGLNSQMNYKWFDEGLAEQEGYRAKAVRFPAAAEASRQNGWSYAKTGYLEKMWINLHDLTTESQWAAHLADPIPDWIYIEAAIAMDYLVMQKGMNSVKTVLVKIGQGTPFATAFQEVFSQTVDQFEAEFLAYLSTH